MWEKEGQPLIIGSRGTWVGVRYGSQVSPSSLEAALSGPARFENGQRQIVVMLQAAHGTHRLTIYAEPGAQTGWSFGVVVTLGQSSLARTGYIGSLRHLPLLLKTGWH